MYITKKVSFLGLKFGIVKPLQSIDYKLQIVYLCQRVRRFHLVQK